jgi:tetratricopeptide (TPR) repeat protein
VNDGTVSYVLFAGIVVTTLAVVALVAWSLGVLRQPRALVQSGHWRSAAVAAERLGASWLRVFPSVREEAAHARAACLHLEGELEASLDVIRAFRGGEQGRLASALALLEGANLVMVGGDPSRAAERLTVACASPRCSPEDLLFLALATHAAGDRARAEEIFAAAPRTRPKGLASPRIYEPAFHYLRGLYLVKTGRSEEAAAELEAAASSPVQTNYVARARALTPPPTADEMDPRSSLTPHVIDEDG